jgi:hypothetical protein
MSANLSSKNSAARSPVVIGIALLAVAGAAVFTTPGRAAAHAFIGALRIPKPQPVNVNVPAFAGANSNRQLQNMVGAMLSAAVNVAVDEPDQPAATIEVAAKLAGFRPKLPHARTDPATLIVTGAHAIDLKVNRDQLRTIFAEAGKPDVAIPEALAGAAFAVRTPRAIRAQYGNCPAPVAPTLQNQLNGPPPPTADNGDCIVVTESPIALADVPVGLDMGQLMEIALELSGMSPAQAVSFPSTIDWRASLLLSVPRNLRSSDPKDVNGAKALLLTTGGRRGPTYVLVWTKDGMVFALTGYGNPGDAVPIANSIN